MNGSNPPPGAPGEETRRSAFPVTYLLKPGELILKGGNRALFEKALRRNLTRLLEGAGRVETSPGRYYVHCREEEKAAVEDALNHLTGISGWAQARICEKTAGAVMAACAAEGKALFEKGIRTFKLEARRTDKSFPLDSYRICAEGGNAVLAGTPGLAVDVKNPQAVVEVEIRENACVYSLAHPGLRGLPAGTAGKGLLLLSGGIDSPVAGYMMASRGMGIDAVHFHAYPYTSREARLKAVKLAEIVGRYAMGIRLYTAPFTAVQARIRERAPLPWATILLRMAMMEYAEKLAGRTGALCLITGESLSQVASQTIENIRCIQAKTGLPVLRPLVGMDKEAIIRTAGAIGTYRTSILPYPDCCVLFSPPHPVLRGDPAAALEHYQALGAGPLIDAALEEGTMEACGFPSREPPRP
ncbi:MAG: tRNA 4-thiouridine(8) synthase ThiI [Treponema sp.]|jgi:thiamine biosynthesis protein ThiI|nr:tRNA 4-thiouridine(8) synthase ThiI [Treponema sp.]